MGRIMYKWIAGIIVGNNLGWSANNNIFWPIQPKFYIEIHLRPTIHFQLQFTCTWSGPKTQGNAIFLAVIFSCRCFASDVPTTLIISGGIKKSSDSITLQLYKLSPWHSSEIRGLCLMKWPSETIQNLPYFMHKKTHVVFFVFHFVQLYIFT